jgi:hypothetical protein
MNTPTVAVLGLPEEGPTQLLLQALAEAGVCTLMLDQRRFEQTPLDIRINDSGELGWAFPAGQRPVALHTLAGLYLRPMDELRLWPADPARGQACRAWTQAWVDVAERLPGRVANRASAMASNGSKPFQSQHLAAAGFSVPPMLLSNDPQQVLDFEAEHGPLIYKSASGVRSIVQPLDASAKARLPHIRHCPTLFQKRLQGTNVRVHVVGEAAFCTEIDSDGLDYRYASREGGETALRNTTLDAETRWRCIRAAHALALPLAGLDLMLADEGLTYCFEVNPSPGFSWYEDATGQPISHTLARWLAGRC